jgi:hypothetical protein
VDSGTPRFCFLKAYNLLELVYRGLASEFKGPLFYGEAVADHDALVQIGQFKASSEGGWRCQPPFWATGVASGFNAAPDFVTIGFG